MLKNKSYYVQAQPAKGAAIPEPALRSAFWIPPELLQYRKTKHMVAEAKRKRKPPSDPITPTLGKKSKPTLDKM